MIEAKQAVTPIIEEILEAVLAAADPERIVLFGSAARGGMGADSDVDLLVVVKKSSFRDNSRYSESRKIRKALWSIPIPIDILIVTPEEVEKWRDSTNHVIARSLREGVVLYDRP